LPRNRELNISDLATFIAREAHNEKGQIQRIDEGDPEEAIVTGDVVGALKPISREAGQCVLRGEKIYFSRFRAGDRVEVAQVDSTTNRFKKIKDSSIRMVRFPEPGVIEILLSSDDLFLDPKADVFLLPKSVSGLKWSLRKRLQEIDESGVEADHFPVDKMSVQHNFTEFTENLNPIQREALRFLVDNDFRGLVQGPPGTGKTHLIVDLIRLAIECKLRVGLASLTHTAVDNALARIIQSGVDPNLVVRVASEKHNVRAEPYKGFDLDQIWAGSFKSSRVQSEFEDTGEYLLNAATLHTWCLTKHPPEIDVLIIDEASQVPIYFHPFLKAICSRVIMFGDHKQLPPVIQVTNHSLPAEDIFSYEIERGDYPMLETQYRMNEGIQEWSSNRFYNGRLQPHESNRHRDVLRDLQIKSKLIGSREVNLLQHQGGSSNNANKTEAGLVADLIWALKTLGGVPLEEIGVVTPHRAQAGAICARLQEKVGLSQMRKVLVDTVERFQGQAKEAMIFSMGVERDHSLQGDRGFLGDGRRLNVAVTRAKSRFYCLAPEKLIENTKKQRNALHLNSFLEWCAADDGDEGREDIA
jgi:DNA replication ATP-dependent helicase Dna2